MRAGSGIRRMTMAFHIAKRSHMQKPTTTAVPTARATTRTLTQRQRRAREELVLDVIQRYRKR